MENIVTGQSSDTRLQEQNDRPTIPRGTQGTETQGAFTGSSVPVPSDFPTMGAPELGGGEQSLANQTLTGLSQPTQGQEQNQQVATPVLDQNTGSQLSPYGLAPWLNDPGVQLLMPDVPNYLNRLRQQDTIAPPPQTGQTTPLPPIFRTRNPVLASPDYVNRMNEEYRSARTEATFRDSLSTKMGISDYLAESGRRSPIDRSMPGGTAIPDSLSNVPAGLYRNFNGGVQVEQPESIVGNLIEQGGAVINLAGAAATQLWNNFWTLDPNQRQNGMNEETEAAWNNFVQSFVSPDDPTTEESDSLFAPSRGFFGEQGRGWLGAANYYVFSPTQQSLMASLYSVSDLGRAIQQGFEVENGRININPANVRTEEFNNRPFHRFQQALEGRDLSFTNVRVPGDDRYFALIPQNASENVQLGAGILGFTLDLLTGGVTDALTDSAVATARVSATQALRGELGNAANIPRNWNIAQRLNRISELRRSRANIPEFTPNRPSTTIRTGQEAAQPPTTQQAQQPQVQVETTQQASPSSTPLQSTTPETETTTLQNQAPNQPTSNQVTAQPLPLTLENIPEFMRRIRGEDVTPTEIVESLDATENVYLVPDSSIINSTGLDFAETLSRYPSSGIFIPEIQIRTPAQIRSFAETLGIEDLPQILTHNDLTRLMNDYGDTFSTVGPKLPDPPPIVESLDDIVETIPTVDSWVQRTRAFNDIDIEDSLTDAVLEQRPAAQIERWLDWNDKNPNNPLRFDRWLHGTELADRLLVESSTSRTLERNIVGLRHAIDDINRGAPHGWGNIADEINTKAAHLNTFDEGTQIRELYDEQPANPSYLLTDRPYYHGTRQADSIFRVNFKEGTAHEYGTGLYLTVDPDYANIAARSQRTPHNPIPGTTRINPTGGFVHEIQPEVAGGVLELGEKLPDDIRELFKRTAREVFDEKVAHIFEQRIRETPARNAWLTVRDVYSEAKRVPVPELHYRRFSNRISDLLNQAGYRGLRDEQRGIFVQLPDLDGRIRGNVLTSTPVVSATRTQSLYARHWMNADMQKHFPRIDAAEGIEKQSRSQLLHSVLQDYVKQYERVRSQYGRTADDFAGFLNYQDELVLDRANRQINSIREDVASLVDGTPEYKEFRNVAPDWECM